MPSGSILNQDQLAIQPALSERSCLNKNLKNRLKRNNGRKNLRALSRLRKKSTFDFWPGRLRRRSINVSGYCAPSPARPPSAPQTGSVYVKPFNTVYSFNLSILFKMLQLLKFSYFIVQGQTSFHITPAY